MQFILLLFVVTICYDHFRDSSLVEDHAYELFPVLIYQWRIQYFPDGGVNHWIWSNSLLFGKIFCQNLHEN